MVRLRVAIEQQEGTASFEQCLPLLGWADKALEA